MDALGAEIVAAGDVLLVPKHEVTQVVFLDELEKVVACGTRFLVMPGCGEGGLESGNLVGIEVHRVGCLKALRLQESVGRARLRDVAAFRQLYSTRAVGR
jgi:hypothetical protein